MTTERRKVRSPMAGEALQLYFRTIIARNNLKAIALANEDALLVAGAAAETQPPLDLVAIAALGFSARERGPIRASLLDATTLGQPIHAAEIVLRGEKLYLVAVGGDLPADEDLKVDIERILDASLPETDG